MKRIFVIAALLAFSGAGALGDHPDERRHVSSDEQQRLPEAGGALVFEGDEEAPDWLCEPGDFWCRYNLKHHPHKVFCTRSLKVCSQRAE